MSPFSVPPHRGVDCELWPVAAAGRGMAVRLAVVAGASAGSSRPQRSREGRVPMFVVTGGVSARRRG